MERWTYYINSNSELIIFLIFRSDSNSGIIKIHLDGKATKEPSVYFTKRQVKKAFIDAFQFMENHDV